ncbi:methyltransferase domain-containing protein [bacterium]|nr:methyltransferase domain-containing protein [bacterium]
MYALETRRLSFLPILLPHALIQRPGHPPTLQIYSPKILPLRQAQKQFPGRIRKLLLRSSAPFQLRIGQRLLITSDHRVVSSKDRSIPRLKIRAGPAFGSGEHATTQLCLRYLTQLLLDHPKSGPTVLDLGCGSGILALASAKFGAHSLGWDLDPTAIQEAQRNAKVNRLTSRVLFQIKDALRAPLPKADLIVANLYDSLLLHLLPRLEKHRKAGTRLVLSGILQGQENTILRTSRKLGWKLQRRVRIGRWYCLQFQS